MEITWKRYQKIANVEENIDRRKPKEIALGNMFLVGNDLRSLKMFLYKH